jgi:hypothetical protein
MLQFFVGLMLGAGAVCLAGLAKQWLDAREQARRIAEEAARIQPRDDGVDAFLDGAWWHMERIRRAQRADKDE